MLRTKTARSSKSVTTQTKRCHNCQNLVQTFFTASQPCSLLRGHTQHSDSPSFPSHFNKFCKIVLASNRREFLVLTQWSVTPCSLVDRKQCLCCFHLQRIAASSSDICICTTMRGATSHRTIISKCHGISITISKQRTPGAGILELLLTRQSTSKCFNANDRNPTTFYSNPNEAILFTPCSDHRVIKTRSY
jgi:hypothetical protein